MGKIHVCPICGGTEFFTPAHVSETWIVDGAGNWLETVTTGDDIIAPPDNGNIWECINCGAEGVLVEDDRTTPEWRAIYTPTLKLAYLRLYPLPADIQAIERRADTPADYLCFVAVSDADDTIYHVWVPKDILDERGCVPYSSPFYTTKEFTDQFAPERAFKHRYGRYHGLKGNNTDKIHFTDSNGKSYWLSKEEIEAAYRYQQGINTLKDARMHLIARYLGWGESDNPMTDPISIEAFEREAGMTWAEAQKLIPTIAGYYENGFFDDDALWDGAVDAAVDEYLDDEDDDD